MRDHRSRTAEPSPWVMRFLPGVRNGGLALDVACGAGRHLAPLLTAGCRVVGIDRDLSGTRPLAGDPRLELIEADLETGATPPFAGRRFDLVVVTSYLWRPLLPAIAAAVADDGMLVYETFAVGNERLGRPTNPEFLLRPGELIAAFGSPLVPIAYEHVRLAEPARIVARICSVGPGHRWLAEGAPTAPP